MSQASPERKPSGVQSRAALQGWRSPLKERMLVSTRLEHGSRIVGAWHACMIPSWMLARCDRIHPGRREEHAHGHGQGLCRLRRPDFAGRALDVARSVTSDVCIVGAEEKFAPFAPVVKDVFRDRGRWQESMQRCGLQRRNSTLCWPWICLRVFGILAVSDSRSAEYGRRRVDGRPRSKGRWEPLCAVYRRKFADAVEKALLAGRNKIDWLFNAAEPE